jgi:hypothetical protein
MSHKHSYFLLISLSLWLLSSCGDGLNTGPDDVRWDRETCARCAMAISDQHYSAQVRGGPAGEKSQLYKFDDIGCAVIWLDKQAWETDPRTEVWVTDFHDGEWIDATTAWYITGKTTPMDYQLGAQKTREENALNFEQAKKHIRGIDDRINAHPGQPLNTPTLDSK